MELNINTIQFMNSSKLVYLKFMGIVGQKYNLSANECSVILFLYRNPELNTARDIVQYRMLAKSNVSTAIDSLKKKNLLDVQPDPNSRRTQRLFLLEKATPIAIALFNQQIEFKKCFENGLTEDELDSFNTLVDKIHKNMKVALEKFEAG